MVTGFIFYAGGGLATCSIQVLQWVEGFPWNFKSAGDRIAGNSAANDEGRALVARWRDKNCHGGISYQVSHLLISAVEVVSLITSAYTYREGVVTPTDPKGKGGKFCFRER